MARETTKNKNILIWQYIALPVIFLLVTLLGGMRLSLETNAFVFLGPSLFNLVLAVMLGAILFRGNLIRAEKWFSPDFPVQQNVANAFVTMTVLAASVQIINCVLPEKGFAFLLTSFFLMWSLWTNLFADFTPGKLLRSLAALFGFAFIFKYVFLASLVSANESWARKLTESFLDGISLGLLDIPKFAAGTGYIAFFTVLLYGAGLVLLAVISYEAPKKETALVVIENE